MSRGKGRISVGTSVLIHPYGRRITNSGKGVVVGYAHSYMENPIHRVRLEDGAIRLAVFSQLEVVVMRGGEISGCMRDKGRSTGETSLA